MNSISQLTLWHLSRTSLAGPPCAESSTSSMDRLHICLFWQFTNFLEIGWMYRENDACAGLQTLAG